ncbi:MAG TPA: NAD-glutamate dehydrogenase [Chthoniobacterales bacterium]|nr:NAD-glutamate dehydrogenase [Chthoniobacterales bacterium]
MLLTAQLGNAEIIEKVVAQFRGTAAEGRIQAETFIRQYYRQVDPEDLAERSISNLCGAVLAHLNFIKEFKSGTSKLRVYNPKSEKDGWESTHTAIEIVNDNMPFLVDSVTMEINRQGLTLHLIIHPVIKTRRDANGGLSEILPREAGKSGASEAVMHVEVDRQTDPEKLVELEAGLLRILGDVRKAVEDYPKMKDNLNRRVADLRKPYPEGLDPETVEEEKALLKWLAESHFTFLGYRDYDLLKEGDEDVLRVVPGSGLGILRETRQTKVSKSFATVTAEVRKLARAPQLLVLTKANSRATVHRPGYLDYVGVKRFDAKGQVLGEQRFLGLYTSIAYNSHPADIPLLRRKVRNVVMRAGFDPNGHLGKALVTILEEHPLDELLQIPEDELFENAMGILRLGERQRTRLFVRSDVYGRFLSCLIYVPRENHSTELRERMQRILMQAFNGISSESTVHLSESVLARVQIIVRTKPGSVPEFDVREIEKQIVKAARRWTDDLHDALIAHFDEERGNQLYHRFGNAFPAGYREGSSVTEAVIDAAIMDTLGAEKNLAMNLYAGDKLSATPLRLKVFHSGKPIPLSSSLPMLEHMDVKVLEQLEYKVEPEGTPPVYVHDFGMSHAGDIKLDVTQVKSGFEEAFARAWRGEIENDDFNRLVLRANLGWREATILRAYSKYLRQTGFTFSQAYMEQALSANAAIAKKLAELFIARFDPANTAEAGVKVSALTVEIEKALDSVENLDEDRMLRRFLAVIQATLRTNYFQKDAGSATKPYISFKFNPALVPGLPEPKPMFEIYVYSPRVEGVHLRGGKVARGGLRWSDRMEDFRTEVLGLMKAQMVKNTVIVPVGSKGGFVVKQPPADREALMKEGIACYQTLLRGLLDLTDNLVAGKVVPPKDLVRHDADDPYLVVAADKGTATFSDIANDVSKQYGFWLDDAFASGGSIGYDHKKMGITARGAWESVKRHFRELGVNTQSTDFTVVGIGDMSGDVFGNGMLLSRHIKLLGAFDHRHVFLDPNPDPEASFIERERLFNLPRSSWADYDSKLISKGGGIYPRSAKSVTLTPEVKKGLGVDADSLTPTDLIRTLLKAPADLLYNGGIGTYVKATHQTHAEVGDRANDAIRVNGKELCCKVVVEGGNLGFTQLGRIEYALSGGKINTDAIDNSAGVDCSDHEVNIKVLLNSVVAEGRMNKEQRNQLLAEMTNEVGALVLRDNYFQTQSLSVRKSMPLDAQTRFIKYLEKAGRLNREIEFLPSDEELASRKAAKTGLTSPERAVLLAYSKITLYDELLASKVPDDPYISAALVRYFPAPLREPYREHMERHPLKREIIATHVTNEMINRAGSTFVHRMQEEVGAGAPDVVRAYLLTREIFDFVSFWQELEALDNKVPHAVQSDMLIDSERLMVRATLWFLRYRNLKDDIAKTVEHFASGVKALAKGLDKFLSPDQSAGVRQAAESLTQSKVPNDLAMRLLSFDPLFSALDIVEIAAETKRSVEEVAGVYFGMGGRLELSWLRKQIGGLPADSHWQTLAKAALGDDVSGLQRELTSLVLKLSPQVKVPNALIKAWEAQNKSALGRSRQVLADLQSAGNLDLSMLSVALRELRNLA